jgi:hypothetical protein
MMIEVSAEVAFFRQVFNLVLYAIQHNKLELLLEIALQAIKGGFDYRTAMMRLDGSYYEAQVKIAAEKFNAKQEEVRVNLPGWEKWKKESEGK